MIPFSLVTGKALIAMSDSKYSDHSSSYSQIACIGSGLSSVALGATLKRWYQFDDIKFFEREPSSGGTWNINSYPGCACDVPSVFYSFSFALDPGWSKLLAPYTEIKKYTDDMTDLYNLRSKIVLSTEVYKCAWQENKLRWLLYLRDVSSGREFTHECQVLFTATGPLSVPRLPQFPGQGSFKGHIFHSSRWSHDVSLEGKDVVVIGNGCTGTQIVPAIVNETKSLTHIIRSKHWILPFENFSYSSFSKWIFRNIPLVMRARRLLAFLIAETSFPVTFMTNKGVRVRQQMRVSIERYIRENTPEKYHDLLLPDYEIGCKRLILDNGYYNSLHNEKLLLTDAEIIEIEPDGIKTSNGFIPADVIVLATGFHTDKPMNRLEVVGCKGESIEDHWKGYGGPEAYNSTSMHGFPNFFMLLGPNVATAHTSSIMAMENAVNYSLRVLKPVIKGEAASIEVNQEAERGFVRRIQGALKHTVWNTGCTSWYVNNNWNGMAYPWSQAYFWYRSVFPTWSDWTIKRIPGKSRFPRKIVGALGILILGYLYHNWIHDLSFKIPLHRFVDYGLRDVRQL